MFVIYYFNLTVFSLFFTLNSLCLELPLNKTEIF